MTPRADGRWCKRVRGRLHIFSGTADEALAEYERVKGDLLLGRKPQPKSDSLSVAELLNAFLHAKRARVASGELELRTWRDYQRACEQVIEAFGRTMPVERYRLARA